MLGCNLEIAANLRRARLLPAAQSRRAWAVGHVRAGSGPPAATRCLPRVIDLRYVASERAGVLVAGCEWAVMPISLEMSRADARTDEPISISRSRGRR